MSRRAGLALALLVAGLAVRPHPGVGQQPAGDVEPLTPGLHITVLEDRYAVRQRELEDAVAALNAAGRDPTNGHGAAGITEYHLEPRWTYEGAVGRCVVTGVQLALNVTVRIPDWVWLTSANDRDRERWAVVVDRLTAHEYAHRDATVEVAGELFRTLRFLTAGSCRRLGREVERAVRDAERDLSLRHAEVDGRPPGRVRSR